MRSKSVSARLTSSDEVQASVQTFGPKVVTLLDERIESPQEGGTPFSYQQVFDHLDGDVEAARLGLVKAEDDHIRQLIRVSDLQRESDRWASDLYDQQVAMRQTLAGVFGPQHGFKLAAISGRTPKARKDLEEQVDQTVKLLRNPEGEAPELQLKEGVTVDFGLLADGLESHQTGLRNARSGLLRARKASARTLLFKHAAIAEFDRVFPAAAGTLEGFFRLVGEVDLADRIRTSIRRVTGRRGAENEGDPAEDAPSKDVESAEATSDAPPSSAAPSVESGPQGSASEPSVSAAPQPVAPAPSEPAKPVSSPT